MTLAIGDRYTAPWGRYQVHRLDGDQVVLREASTFTRCVVVPPSKLATVYAREDEPAAAPLALELVGAPPSAELAKDRPPAKRRSTRAPEPPRPAVVDATGQRACANCHQLARAFAAVGEVEYCFRCYGVTEQRETPALSSASGWTPAPGEDDESRGDVGSFARPPPSEVRPRPPRPRPRRVKADEWQQGTGGLKL